MGLSRIFSVCLILVELALPAVAQFPEVCMANATKPEAVCCPTPPGFTEPCGGPGRGKCVRIQDNDEDFSPRYDELANDDRLNWPHRFFSYSCQCENNYYGYQCNECHFGFKGETCTERHTVLRQNIQSLTDQERKHFRETVNKAKYTKMEGWAILTNVWDTDPVTNPTWRSVTVYDFFVFLHTYVARHTVLPQYGIPMVCDGPDPPPFYDMGHSGPGFPMWHRLYNLALERELQRVSGDEDFALPYWVWVGLGNKCDVCHNGLVGKTDLGNDKGYLDTGSIFSTWQTLCKDQKLLHNCRVCNTSEPAGPVIRTPHNPDHPMFPNQTELDFTMTRLYYDTAPYDGNAPPDSFRACLEGSAGMDGHATIHMHATVHQFFIGTLASVPTSANDPIFLGHHIYVDRLLEQWIRDVRPSITELPLSGAPAGHNRNAHLVPFFPVHRNSWYLRDSRSFGYTYDDLEIDIDIDDSDEGNMYQLATIVLAVIVVLLVLALFYCLKLRASESPPPPYGKLPAENTILMKAQGQTP